MSKTTLVGGLAGTVTVLVGTCFVFGLASTYPQGKPVTAQPDWPDGLGNLVNSENRTIGYFVNANDFFVFTGDTETLNAFLVKYATLKVTKPRVVLHAGKGRIPAWVTKDSKYKTPDWRLDIIKEGWAPPSEKPGATIHVWLGGGVDLDGLKVPAAVTVESGQEIEKYISSHKQRQKAHTTPATLPTTDPSDK